MTSTKKYDVVVYGATGFTGQLVVEYLAKQYPASVDLNWAMAGRSLSKLESIRDAVGAAPD
ncbi:MAG: saccharopine dehydrogenase, partial [Alteromonas sp.]